MKILVFNAGSSSQKSCLYDLSESLPGTPPVPLWEAHAEWEGGFRNARLKILRGGKSACDQPIEINSGEAAIRQMLDALGTEPDEIDAIGHRVVHGGPHYRETVRITPDVKATILQFAKFAPQHNPAELAGIETAETIFKSQPQFAAFDTAFHRTIPDEAAIYPGPYEWFEQEIRRYGFHGINHQYCAARAATMMGKELKSLRLVTCHLGHGCSLAAVRDAKSIGTTMGFTPLEGLMMANRSGSIDPGILTYLLREKRYSAAALEEVLNHQSGLLGVSGISDDMRQILHAVQEGNLRARLAFDAYIHRLRFYIGAMAAVLGGVDGLVFTAGVGENSAEVRAAACNGLEFLGVRIDKEKNQQSSGQDRDISAPGSAAHVLVITAQEDWAIATECFRLLRENRTAA